MMTPETIEEVLRRASFCLRKAGVEQPGDEAELLLAHLMGAARLDLFLQRRMELPAPLKVSFEAALARRRRGEPLAYITGTREFYGLTFAVNPDVLIPRPETEFVVDAALEWAKEQGRLRGEGICGLDLGTGSGNLAVTLAHLLPQACFWAVDLSPQALRVAAGNARRHGVNGRIRWRCGSYFQAFAGMKRRLRFNLVVANPPYISRAALENLPEPVKNFEPRLALDGGPDGLAGYRNLLADLPRYISSPGLAALEIGAGQDRAVLALCREAGLFRALSFRRDYQGWPRVIEGLI